ncbi:DUF6542 domain-containing protein [Labedaea rhizosphaerae]|uniref:DUF6542 domain-containing protein n=1 Tax=Labedaea rhizosphaerae TaxID=598644 RepID=A0A4R6S7T3_LABRH|nr:DUF6542 domain-containing protein [Labedaea rhizosphaerae]TDP94875.1 hypothetical protein EV186_105107 [Labedaea rhizosphaerae]
MSTKGLPWWAVAAGATAVAGVGGLVGGPYFPAAVVAGCVLAAIAANRSAFFTVVAQPPLIVTAIAVATLLFGQSFLGAVAQLSTVFPYLAATMAAVGLIVLVRLRLGRNRRA